MKKRLFLLILIAVLIIAGVAGALYFATQKQQEKVEEQEVPVQQTRKILDDPLISPVAGFDNNSIWYFNSDGQLFQINPTGSSKSEFPLPSSSDENVRSVIWPKDGPDFIAVTGTTTEISKHYYDSKAKIYIDLPKNIQDLDWLPDGKRVVYIWQSADKASQQLVTANADGSGYKMITQVFWPDLIVKASSDGKTILMYRSLALGDSNKIYLVNLETGAVITIVDQGINIAAKWITADKFLYATATKVYLYDMADKQITDLNLSTTLDQVVSDSAGRVLYANVNGLFRKIDLSKDTSEPYFQPSHPIEAKLLLLLGNTVFYIDKTDNKLYSISK